MNITLVHEPCQPYPSPIWDKGCIHQLTPGSPDFRDSRWLNEIVERLSAQELQNLVRTFALCDPRRFQQELALQADSRAHRARRLREALA